MRDYFVTKSYNTMFCVIFAGIGLNVRLTCALNDAGIVGSRNIL